MPYLLLKARVKSIKMFRSSFDREAELLLSFDRYEDTKALLEKREQALVLAP